MSHAIPFRLAWLFHWIDCMCALNVEWGITSIRIPMNVERVLWNGVTISECHHCVLIRLFVDQWLPNWCHSELMQRSWRSQRNRHCDLPFRTWSILSAISRWNPTRNHVDRTNKYRSQWLASININWSYRKCRHSKQLNMILHALTSGRW